MKPIYKFLLSSLDAFGHINFTLGFGELLIEAGHEVTFTHRDRYASMATKRGFKFIPFDESFFANQSPAVFLEWTEKNLSKFRSDALTRYSNWSEADKELYSSVVNEYEPTNKALAAVLKDHKDSFDVIIADYVTRFPALYSSPIPYIHLASINPLSLYPQGPPPFSGYPTKLDEETYAKFKQVYDGACIRFKEKLFAWWKEYNTEPLPEDNYFVDIPKHMGFYHYPEALDYSECGPKITDKWIRIDANIRKPDSDETFTVPSELVGLPGKLIYFSLGSLGSIDVALMRELIAILAQAPHRFIVSKGPRGDEIVLPSNMWGQNYVNQIEILKVVDLVITHGGNNTFMETLYFGKPLIVLPFFFDQFDNAQRVVDCGIGRRLDTWKLDNVSLLKAIDETLADTEMQTKISAISKSMQSADSGKRAVKMIEEFVGKLKAK